MQTLTNSQIKCYHKCNVKILTSMFILNIGHTGNRYYW